MTYADRAHLHNREVKLRLDAENHERLKRLAAFKSTQPSVLVRMYVEALLDKVERGEFSPLEQLLEDQQRQRA